MVEQKLPKLTTGVRFPSPAPASSVFPESLLTQSTQTAPRLSSAVTRRQYLRGVLLVIGATAGWALSGLFSRLLEEKDPWQTNALRGLSFAFWMTLFTLLRYRGQFTQTIRQIPWVAAIACPGFFAVGSSLYLWSLSLTSVAASSSIGATAPLFAAGLAYLVMGERSPPVVLLASLVAMIGVVWMTIDGMDSGDALSLTSLGLVVSLGYAFLFAAQSVTLRRYSAIDVTPTFILAGLITGIGIFSIVGIAAFSWHDIGLMVLMGLVQLTIPIALYARGARYLSTVTLMLITLLDTVLNPLFTWVGVGEVPGWNVVIGSAVIVGAVAAAIIARTRARPV